ncbi:MAG TPA: hypothetical protein VLT83_05100 [Opitutaceae bacterium]|nr:hypothetical protein [Opitutaceae bacterium]
MKDFDARWQRLVVAARRVPAAEEVAAPYGFATRIAARALGGPARPALLAVFARFSVRALWVAGVLALASMAANYLAFAGNEEDDQGPLDPVSEVVASS